MSKREDAQSGAVAPLSMQQPTGVIRMSTLHNEKPMSPAYAKSALCFAMPFYCLKSPIPIPPDHQSANRSLFWRPYPVSICTNGATRLFLPLIVDRKNKEEIIETP
jgi:hypothetical protein